jgi:diguanylate cyclase (GGDEF)-like protein
MRADPEQQTGDQPPTAGGSSLDQTTTALGERLWQGAIIVNIALLPFTVLRGIRIGWMPLDIIYMASTLLLVSIHFARRHVPLAWRVVIAVGGVEVSGALSVIALGFVGFGTLWMAVGSFMVGVLYGWRNGLLAIGANLLVIGYAMSGFLSGRTVLPMDVPAYMQSLSPWILCLLMLTVFPWLLLNSIGLYQRAMIRLVRETETQRAEIERMAARDPLTGLARLHVVRDRLEAASARAGRAGNKVAVLFVDLDGFKKINDQLGHAAGDHVLASVGQTLRAAVRDVDLAGRIGGDEFLLILEGLPSEEPARKVATRVLQGLCQPVTYQDSTLQVGASIGIALYPEHGSDPVTLQRTADSAMYLVKRAGKNGLAIHGQAPEFPVRVSGDADGNATIRHLRLVKEQSL